MYIYVCYYIKKLSVKYIIINPGTYDTQEKIHF